MCKAIDNHENICFKCLQEKPIKTYHLYRSDYGSSFDNNYTHLQICNNCSPDKIESWFNEEPEIIDGYCANYELEKDILEFVNLLPLEGQELFWNRCAYGACAYIMDSQDWIDKKLGILPDEKYEEYGFYSPRQIEAYKERFPNCEYSTNEIYNDSSKGCWCPFGANGEYGQIADAHNISDECYECKYYKPRETEIKDIKHEDFEDYMAYIRSNINFAKWEEKFGK